MAARLFVGNLPYDTTEADLRAHFAAVGPISYISLPTDRETGRPRGFAFIEFIERADAEEAIRRLHNQAFQGRPLAVNEARAREGRPTPDSSRPSASRPSASRPSSSAEKSAEDGRNFGPDAAPRRRRRSSKDVAKFDRGPKRPTRKRAAGPVRFGAEEDDSDDDGMSYGNFARRLEDSVDHDTE
jgi:RNA recognition motif-containing protein